MYEQWAVKGLLEVDWKESLETPMFLNQVYCLIAACCCSEKHKCNWFAFLASLVVAVCLLVQCLQPGKIFWALCLCNTFSKDCFSLRLYTIDCKHTVMKLCTKIDQNILSGKGQTFLSAENFQHVLLFQKSFVIFYDGLSSWDLLWWRG